MRLGNCKHTEDVSSSACPQFQVLVEGLVGLDDGGLKAGDGSWPKEGKEGSRETLLAALESWFCRLDHCLVFHVS